MNNLPPPEGVVYSREEMEEVRAESPEVYDMLRSIFRNLPTIDTITFVSEDGESEKGTGRE